MATCVRLCGVRAHINRNFIEKIPLNTKRSIHTSVSRHNGLVGRHCANKLAPYGRNQLFSKERWSSAAALTSCRTNLGVYSARKEGQCFQHRQISTGSYPTVSLLSLDSHKLPSFSIRYSNRRFNSYQDLAGLGALARHFSSGPPSGSDGSSSSSNADGGDENNNDGSDRPPIPEYTTTSFLPAAPMPVPEEFSQVPIIAVKRNPVFPRFIKMIEVQIIEITH